LLAFVNFGCGGGGGSSSGSGSSSSTGSSLSCENNGIPKFSVTFDSTAKAGQLFNETYTWCDSDGDITELWGKGTFRGVSTTQKFNAAEFGITGTSGTQQNRYTWGNLNGTGDFFIDSWVVDAKGNKSNVVSSRVTITAKEVGQYKIASPGGEGFLSKILQKLN
jgi:hypothetical protein